MTDLTPNNPRNNYGALEMRGKFYTTWDRRLDPAVRDKWIEALLSGDYEQGQRMLVTPEGGHCCLGVYCDTFDVPFVVRKESVPSLDYKAMRTVELKVFGGSVDESTYGSFTFIPPKHNPDLFDSQGVKIDGYGFYGSEVIFEMKSTDVGSGAKYPITLPDLNDKGFTFAQIADVIRYFL